MRGSPDFALLVGRFCLCLLFIVSGFNKIAIMSGFAAAMAAKGLPYPDLIAILAIVIELGGGLVLALGIETCLLAVLFAAYVVVATLISHAFWTLGDPAARAANALNFYKNISIIGGFLTLAVIGGGRYSVDAFLNNRGLRPWARAR